MQLEDLEDAHAVVTRLLAEVERGNLDAPPKLLRLLQATQTALTEQVQEHDPDSSNEG
jgi:hypothetical protein